MYVVRSTKVKYSYLAFNEEVLYAVGITDRSHVSLNSVRLDGTEKSSRNVAAVWIASDNK